jgi:hypothetical protein
LSPGWRLPSPFACFRLQARCARTKKIAPLLARESTNESTAPLGLKARAGDALQAARGAGRANAGRDDRIRGQAITGPPGPGG